MDEHGALERGLAVIRLLNETEGLNLEQMVRRTGFPKTSLFRIAQTLVNEGIIVRDSGGCYHPLFRLQALVDPRFEDCLRQTMQLLSLQAGQTVEWYLPQFEGLVLSAQELPQESETGVRARVGFLRAWQVELEAVLCVGAAFLKPDGIKLDPGGWLAYQEPFILSRIPRVQAEARIAQTAKTGSARDDIPNANNVRRVAALVRHDGRPTGVLAIAEVVHPASPDRIIELETQLLEAVSALNKNNHTSFHS